MPQEEKQLLLKDLCARLPYATKVFYEYVDNLDKKTYGYSLTLNTWCINELVAEKAIVKPYLRPMSSMTEEEEIEYDATFSTIKIADGHYDSTMTYKSFDFLNAHHFDFRNLIKRGLAIEVTEENNPIRVGTNIEWIDMDTLEAHCYNCCLFDNGCKDISLCKRPTNAYKGFYIEKNKML